MVYSIISQKNHLEVDEPEDEEVSEFGRSNGEGEKLCCF
jgi:hypothetical protein